MQMSAFFSLNIKMGVLLLFFYSCTFLFNSSFQGKAPLSIHGIQLVLKKQEETSQE